MTKLPWREKKLAFVTIFPTHMMVVTNRSTKAGFKSSKDLCGKTAGTIKDTSYQMWLQGQNDGPCAGNPIQIRLMTFEEASKAVDTGKVDFIVQNIDETMWLGSPFKNSVAAFAVGPIYEQGWAFERTIRTFQRLEHSEAQRLHRIHCWLAVEEFRRHDVTTSIERVLK
jgi:ABC-type amino acid transport substrate-binding protein